MCSCPGYQYSNSGKVLIYQYYDTAGAFELRKTAFGASYYKNLGLKVWLSGDGKLAVSAERDGGIHAYKYTTMGNWEDIDEFTVSAFGSYATGGISGSYDGKVLALGSPTELYGTGSSTYVYVASPVDGTYTLSTTLTLAGNYYPASYPLVTKDGDSIFVASSGNSVNRYETSKTYGPWNTSTKAFSNWQYIGVLDMDDGLLDYRNFTFVNKTVSLQGTTGYHPYSNLWFLPWTSSHPSTKVAMHIFSPALSLDDLTRSQSQGNNVTVPAGYTSTYLFSSSPGNSSYVSFTPSNFPSVSSGVSYSLCAIIEGDQYFVRGSCVSPISFYCNQVGMQARYGSKCDIVVYNNVSIVSTSFGSTGIAEGVNFTITVSYSVPVANDTIKLVLNVAGSDVEFYCPPEATGYHGSVTFSTALTSAMVISQSMVGSTMSILKLYDSYYGYQNTMSVPVVVKTINSVNWVGGGACTFTTACAFKWSSSHPSITADVYLTLPGSTLTRGSGGQLESSSGTLMTILTGQSPGTQSFTPSAVTGVTASPSTIGSYILYVVVSGDTTTVRSLATPQLIITCPAL